MNSVFKNTLWAKIREKRKFGKLYCLPQKLKSTFLNVVSEGLQLGRACGVKKKNSKMLTLAFQESCNAFPLIFHFQPTATIAVEILL